MASRASTARKVNAPLLEQSFKDEAEKHSRYSALISILCKVCYMGCMGDNIRIILVQLRRGHEEGDWPISHLAYGAPRDVGSYPQSREVSKETDSACRGVTGLVRYIARYASRIRGAEVGLWFWAVPIVGCGLG